MSGPAVSVLMPVYNARRYLPEAVDSVLAQSLRDFELIVVDDGSTDGSGELLRTYARRDGRIRLISRPNTGIVGALNEALAAARAPLVARMDGDDVCLPQRLARQAQYLQKHEQCVLLGSRVLLIDAEGHPIRPWAMETTHQQIDAAHLRAQWPMVHPAVMMRTEAIVQVGGYRQQYNTLEDLDLFLRLAEAGELANLPEILLHYRQHFHATCYRHSAQQGRIRRELLAEAYRRRGLAMDQSLCLEAPPSPVAEQHSRWAWWALGAGYVSTARKHAMLTLRHAPFCLGSWRLMACALRGY